MTTQPYNHLVVVVPSLAHTRCEGSSLCTIAPSRASHAANALPLKGACLPSRHVHGRLIKVCHRTHGGRQPHRVHDDAVLPPQTLSCTDDRLN